MTRGHSAEARKYCQAMNQQSDGCCLRGDEKANSLAHRFRICGERHGFMDGLVDEFASPVPPFCCCCCCFIKDKCTHLHSVAEG